LWSTKFALHYVEITLSLPLMAFAVHFIPTRVWRFRIIQIDNVPNIICIARDQIQSTWYAKNSVQLYQRLFKWWNLQSEMLEFENYLISSAQKAISAS
jgi:hypothetical protein